MLLKEIPYPIVVCNKSMFCISFTNGFLSCIRINICSSKLHAHRESMADIDIPPNNLPSGPSKSHQGIAGLHEIVAFPGTRPDVGWITSSD